MKNIPEERLSTIGKLIEVTREEKRNKSQNKYTMKSFVEGICTVNDYFSRSAPLIHSLSTISKYSIYG